MIHKLKTLSIFLILFICQEYVYSAQNQDRIQVEVFPGIGSNLIVWELSEPPEIDSLNLFRTNSLRDPFVFIKNISAVPNRYLDTDVSPKNRYFYKLVYQFTNDHQWSSDLDTPPFGRPLKMNEYVKIFIDYFKHDNIKRFEDWTTALIEMHISNSGIFPSGFNLKRLSILLTSSSQSKFPWIDHFPVSDVFKMETILKDGLWKQIPTQFNQDMNLSKPYFRNEFIMTPQEWERKVNQDVNQIEDRINFLLSSCEDELEFLKKQKPVRGSWLRFEENQHWIDLTALNPEHFSEKKITLSSNGNSKTVSFPENAVPGSIISVIIPEEWFECSLSLDGISIQKFVMDHSQSEKIAISLRNEFILNSGLENTCIIPEVNQSVWINELMFDPEFQTLSIELLHEPDVIAPVTISVNSTETWIYSPVYSNEPTIVDSQFIIHDFEADIIWVHLNTNPESSIPNALMESFPLTRGSKTVWARNPKDMVWEQTSISTMGLKNQLQKRDDGSRMIPELFALYQNYPNPFNLETSIKFDLLKESVVSLYVLNAAGLIESVYLDNEELTPGTYSYAWQGNHHSSGVYFVTLQAILDPYEPVVMSRKMIYLK